MKQTRKLWPIVATVLMIAGCILFTWVMTTLKWDFRSLSTHKFETRDYEISEAFHSISIDTDTADIEFISSETAESVIVLCEYENAKHSVSVENGTLTIKENDARRWYDHVGINFDSPKITVSIPQGEYGALSVTPSTGSVKLPEAFRFETIEISTSTGHITCQASASGDINLTTSTGDIHASDHFAGSISFSVSTGEITASDITCEGDLKIHVSTGKTNLSNITCQNLNADGTTGDISLENVTVSEICSIERTTGDVEFKDCEAAEVSVTTDTGDVTGNFLTEMCFVVETNTGEIDVPKSDDGGRCEISTSTGDIHFTEG